MHSNRRTVMLGGAGAMLFGLFGRRKESQAMTAENAYSFSFSAIDGGYLPLSSFRGKAILVVNTASQCGFTKQYEGLQALWDAYRERGLVVLGVPSNDFGGQEPGTEQQIQDFCTTTFRVNFPMTAKQVVSGDAAHPFYRWARETLGVIAAPKWNFHKYLIAPDGSLVDWFSSVTDPMSDKVRAAVDAALKKS